MKSVTLSMPNPHSPLPGLATSLKYTPRQLKYAVTYVLCKFVPEDGDVMIPVHVPSNRDVIIFATANGDVKVFKAANGVVVNL